MKVRLYVRDLAVRMRVASAAEGLEGEVAVVDLADERCLADFLAERPSCPAVGFYPHVQASLAHRAREAGIEPVPKRVFFADPAALLRERASR